MNGFPWDDEEFKDEKPRNEYTIPSSKYIWIGDPGYLTSKEDISVLKKSSWMKPKRVRI